MGRRQHIRRSYRRQTLAIRRRDDSAWPAKLWKRSTSTVWGALGLVVPVLVILGLAPFWIDDIPLNWLTSLGDALEPVQWSGVWQVQVAVAAIALPLLLLTLTGVRDEWMFTLQSRTVLLRESWILFAWQYAVGGALVIGLHSALTLSGGALAVDTLGIVCPTILLTAVALYRVLGLLLDTEKLRRKAARYAGETLRDSLAETVLTNVARNAAARRMSDLGIYFSPFVVDWPDSTRIKANLRGRSRMIVDDIRPKALEKLGRVVAPLHERAGEKTAAGPVQATKNLGEAISSRNDTLLVLRLGNTEQDQKIRSKAEKTVSRAFIVREKGTTAGLPEAHKAMLDQVVAHLVHLVNENAVTTFEADLQLYGGMIDALLDDAAAYRDAFGELATASSYHWPGPHMAELERLKDDIRDIMEAVLAHDRFAFIRGFISFLESAAHDALARNDGAFARYLLSRAVDVYHVCVSEGRPNAEALAGMLNLRLDHAVEFGPVRDRLESVSSTQDVAAVSNDLGSLLVVWSKYLMATFAVKKKDHFVAACETLGDQFSAMISEIAMREWESKLGGEERVQSDSASVLQEFQKDRLTVFFGVGSCILRWTEDHKPPAGEATQYLEALPLPTSLEELTVVLEECVDVLYKGDPLGWDHYGEGPLMKPVMIRPMLAREWLTRFWVRQALQSTDVRDPRVPPTIKPSATMAAIARGGDSELEAALGFLRHQSSLPADLGEEEFERRAKVLLEAAASAALGWDAREAEADGSGGEVLETAPGTE